MSAPSASTLGKVEPSPAQIAKAALLRLAQAKLEPTPDNFSRAWAAETVGGAGVAAASVGTEAPRMARAAEVSAPAAADPGRLWADLSERLLREVHRPTKQWTLARRRESLQRVFDGSRSDAGRLQQRLQGLLTAWEGDGGKDQAAGVPEVEMPGSLEEKPWLELADHLHATVQSALPPQDPRAVALADRLTTLTSRLPVIDELMLAEVEAVCIEAQALLGQRHRLVQELLSLCHELSDGLVDLADDDQQTKGLLQNLKARLGEGDTPQVRALRAARATFYETRLLQRGLRDERRSAQDALKQMIRHLLHEVSELDAHTDRFDNTLQRHAQAVQEADSLQSLASVVSALVADSQAVSQLVRQARSRMAGEHDKALELNDRVQALEAELRALSEVATTDALTQVANRRGLQSAFETELARVLRAGESALPLSMALIDIDNFKNLNDSLGHAAGDQALKLLAAAVRERLRPGDHLARFGGEEFVVLLPNTEEDVAAQTITRLQRSLTEALFLHGQQEVFVTFSAGVTSWRPFETLEGGLERADTALYEAKRTGKNRTCIATAAA